MTVSHTPRAINHIIASDITQNLYFYLIFLQELNRRQRVFVAAVQLRQHHAEFHAAGIIHLGADNVVVHVEAASGFRQQRRIDRLAGELQTQQRLAAALTLRRQARGVVVRDIQMQRGLNELLGQRGFRV